jgi:predicted kinase
MNTSRVAGRLIVICGLPGAGKTTLARRMERELHAVRLSADDWMNALAMDLNDEAARARIESLQWTLAQQLLERGSIVVVEWGSWTRGERDVLRLGAQAVGAAVELHYLHAPANVLLERVQRRGAEEMRRIAPDALERWLEAFEPPTLEEVTLFDEPLDERP